MRDTATQDAMENLLKLLSGPWTSLIIWSLSRHGAARFVELKKRLDGISSKVLTERLRMLEAAGMVTRQVAATTPPQVSYGLATRGEELRRVFAMLQEVAAHWAHVEVRKSHNRKSKSYAEADSSATAE